MRKIQLPAGKFPLVAPVGIAAIGQGEIVLVFWRHCVVDGNCGLPVSDKIVLSPQVKTGTQKYYEQTGPNIEHGRSLPGAISSGG